MLILSVMGYTRLMKGRGSMNDVHYQLRNDICECLQPHQMQTTLQKNHLLNLAFYSSQDHVGYT